MIFFRHVGYSTKRISCLSTESYQVDYDHYYAHYNRFGRGEKQASQLEKVSKPTA